MIAEEQPLDFPRISRDHIEEMKDIIDMRASRSLDSFIDEFDFSEEQKQQNDDKSLCQICYSNYRNDEGFALEWGHKYWMVCTRSMLEVKIKEGKVVKLSCLSHQCSSEFSEVDLRTIFDDAVIIEKYKQFLKNIEVNVDDEKKWCPFPNCKEWVAIDLTNSDANIKCSQGHEFCHLCLDTWHQDDCKFEQDVKLLEWVREKNVKFCPNWKWRTEKNEGCNHMTCRCGSEWCWKCQTIWGPDHEDHMFNHPPNVQDDIFAARLNQHNRGRRVRNHRHDERNCLIRCNVRDLGALFLFLFSFPFIPIISLWAIIVITVNAIDHGDSPCKFVGDICGCLSYEGGSSWLKCINIVFLIILLVIFILPLCIVASIIAIPFWYVVWFSNLFGAWCRWCRHRCQSLLFIIDAFFYFYNE